VSTEYRNNHYVPQWYQRRFIPAEQTNCELFYLDLHPETFVDGRGTRRTRKALRRLGPRKCFAQDDLYTTWFAGLPSRQLERVFFGQIDDRGKRAVEFFAGYNHTSLGDGAFQDLLVYLSTQKLRTPKGLGWLAQQIGSPDQLKTLRALTQFRNLYSAIWTECVWQIADASQTETKFIVTDHPVTVYNRALGPRNRQWCRGFDDPDIRLQGSHTLFPLSGERMLILTNHSWATNPYQSPTAYRANPDFFRGAMFNFTDIQIGRQLTEEEVHQINFILKSRALRFIGAAREEWLHPEQHVSKSDWNVYGDGLLLMPDPRPLVHGSEIIIGYDDGSTEALDHLGRPPGHPDFGRESRGANEMQTLHRFQAEFAEMCGPRRRGRSLSHGQLDPEEDTPDTHEYYLRGKQRGQRYP